MLVDVIIASNLPNVDCARLMRELGFRGGGRKDWARGAAEPWRVEVVREVLRELRQVQ